MPTGAGLRPGAKAPDEPPDPTGGAPALDPTGERGEETYPWDSACGPVAKAPDKPPTPTGYAPLLDSTWMFLVICVSLVFCRVGLDQFYWPWSLARLRFGFPRSPVGVYRWAFLRVVFGALPMFVTIRATSTWRVTPRFEKMCFMCQRTVFCSCDEPWSGRRNAVALAAARFDARPISSTTAPPTSHAPRAASEERSPRASLPSSRSGRPTGKPAVLATHPTSPASRTKREGASPPSRVSNAMHDGDPAVSRRAREREPDEARRAPR